jgi:hypothetical protein
MSRFLKPHSGEWFVALAKINPQQAAQTRQMIELAGTLEACSVCGDMPAHDYEVVGAEFDQNTIATIRLCDDCRSIRQETQGEKYLPIRQGPESSSNN